MSRAWFLSPYGVTTQGPLTSRRLTFDDATSQIEAQDGYWSETEIEGDRALVCCRAPSAMLDSLAHDFQRVDDPFSVWTPTRTTLGGIQYPSREVPDVDTEVLSDAKVAEYKKKLADLIVLSDREGYVRLPGGWSKENQTLVTMAGRKGYPLDRISTGTFPVSPVIDDFNRTSVNPIGGDWTTLTGWNDMQILSSTLTANVTEYGAAFLSTMTFQNDREAYMTLTTLTSNDGTGMGVFSRLWGAPATSANGYHHIAKPLTGTDISQIERWDAGAATTLGAQVSQEWAAGEKLGGESIGSDHTMYRYTGGAWASMAVRTDATYSGTGHIGMLMYNLAGVGRADDFGGGPRVGSFARVYDPVPFWRRMPGVRLGQFATLFTSNTAVADASLPPKDIVALQAMNRSSNW